MKKMLYTVILVLMLVTSTVTQAANKIVVVNVSSIFQHLSQRAMIAKQLEDEFKSRAIELQSIERDLQPKIQRLQRDSSIMKASERNSLEKLVIAQRETFSAKARAFEQDNRRRQAEERNKILSRIQEAVKSVATKEGYDVVIDVNFVVYATNTTDITTKVLNQVK